MKIGIDLNDVYRAFTSQFASYYKKNIDRTFNIDEVDVWTNDLSQIFHFDSRKEYLDFLYNDFPYEIFGCTPAMDKNLPARLNDWIKEISNLDEIPELCFISTKEYDKSIGASYFCLSKHATKIRETHMLLDENLAWEKCDVLITANPQLINNTPDNKIVIKINASYNEESETEFEFASLMDFLNDIDILDKLNKKLNK